MATRRRGHNEGSIYQRKSDGRWVGAVSLDWASGKRRRRVVYGKTRAEAAAKLSDVLSTHLAGLPVQTADITVSAYLDQWLETSVRDSVRPRTYDSYESHVRLHLNPELGKIKLTQLTQQHVSAMMRKKLGHGLSNRTVSLARAVLRIALADAMRQDLVHRNVAALAKPPKAIQYEARALDTPEAKRLLDEVRGDRLEALYAVAVSLGLRQSEAFGLRWSDVDFDAGTITVWWQMRRVDGEPTWVEPKSKRSRRTIPVPAPLLSALRKHRARQLEERLKAGPRWEDCDLVFCTPIGTPLDDSNIRKRFYRHLENADLPRVRYQDLRHSAASLLAARGVDQRTVMEILGHSQMSTTVNVYMHVATDSMREATDKISDLFEPQTGSS